MGNTRSGRRPSVETLLADAGMTSRLLEEVLARLVRAHRDHGRDLATIHQLIGDGRRQVGDALATHRRGAIRPVPRAA